MIVLVISPNLILTIPAEAALPAGTPIILYENRATFGAVAASSTETGYPASNLTNPATNIEWRAATAAAVEWTVTLGAGDDIDAVGIARHNFETAGITVEVGYYAAGPTWVSLAGPQTLPNNEPLLFHFTAQPLTSITVKLGAGSEPARAAVLYVGKALIMERGVDINPDFAVPRFSRRTEFVAGKSERGDYLGRIATAQWIEGVQHTYKYLTAEWYRSHFDPFVRLAQQDVPFFYCFAPDEYPHEVAFVWLADDPIGMTNPATMRKGVQLKMDGILE